MTVTTAVAHFRRREAALMAAGSVLIERDAGAGTYNPATGGYDATPGRQRRL